jgi:small subunit ribosomal protein S1
MNIATSTDQGPTDQNTPNQSPTDQSATDQNVNNQSPTNRSSTGEDLDEYLTNGYDYKALRRGDILTGVILAVNEHRLVVDIGSKREGFVYAEDLERLDEETRSGIQVGETVPVLVLRPTDREGHPILSIHQARLHEDWLKAEQMMESGELYEGEVAGHNRGGLIVRFGKIRGFVPASQIVGLPRRLSAEDRRQRLENMVGQQIGLRIIEVDRRRRRLIFSQRRALRAWQELQRERVMAQLTKGETRHGKVTDITSFGAFVDLGGADGLIHVSELSWRRIDNPREILKIGQEVDVYVLDVDRGRKRIALSLKKLEPDPWTLADNHYRVGQLVEGRITRVLDFGAFVELDLGVEGLLHASEMIGTPELHPSDIVHPDETLPVKIIRIESRRRRIALSARQVRKGEWERWVAEQQATRESQETAAREVVEEEAAAPAPEAAISETVGEEAAAPEAAISEAAEEEAAAPEAAISEAAEEEAAAPEAAISETVGEEAAAPEAAISEAVEEEAAAPEAAISEAVEEEAAAPEAAISEAVEEETTAQEVYATEAHAEEVSADEAESQVEVLLAPSEEAAEFAEVPAPEVAPEAEAAH